MLKRCTLMFKVYLQFIFASIYTMKMVSVSPPGHTGRRIKNIIKL